MPEKCRICERDANSRSASVGRNNNVLTDCGHCGQYVTHKLALKGDSQFDRPKLSAIVRELHLEFARPVALATGWPFEKFGEGCTTLSIKEALARWPRTTADRFDRALRNIARKGKRLGAEVECDQAILFAIDCGEHQFIFDTLIAESWIRGVNKYTAQLTHHGWARVAELERTESRTNPAFVAMWFGGGEPETPAFMHALFESGIRPAVARAGYRCDRVDLVPHNDFIMDQVLGMIRVAPFVIADFTGNRGGIYFEAGFARGLGKPVVHTCRSAHLEHAHFDIKQINTIVWDDPNDLATKLEHRIKGTLGMGPFRPTNATQT